MMRMIAVLAMLGMALPAQAVPDYWTGYSSGWFWYEPLAVPQVKPVKAAKQPVLVPEAEIVPPQVRAHKRLAAQLEHQRIVAIMAPTEANIKAYLYTQKEVLDRSATFADMWQRVVWSEPDLDYSLTGRPTNAAAVYAYDANRARDRKDLLASIAEDHGLFFAFGPECPQCEQMANMLLRVEDRFGMPVQGIAVNDAKLMQLPDSWPDNGFAAAVGIESLPAVVLVRLDGSDLVQPIAYGPLSDEELVERIAVLAATPVGQRF